MKKIIAFGASYSKNSINKIFAEYAAKQFENSTIEILDLNDYALPLFTVDVIASIGVPDNAQRFLDKLLEADFLIISMTEHNGNYSAAFKNLFDWVSMIQYQMFKGKNILLLSTSPGKRGGASSLEIAKKLFPLHGAFIINSFSLPSFERNFDINKGITNSELKQHFMEVIQQTKDYLSE